MQRAETVLKCVKGALLSAQARTNSLQTINFALPASAAEHFALYSDLMTSIYRVVEDPLDGSGA